MRIAAIGTPNRIVELRKKISSNHEIVEVKNNNFQSADMVFDLNFDDNSTNFQDYCFLTDIPVVVGAVKRTLEQALHKYAAKVECTIIGMNTLPTFIDRPLVEMTSLRDQDRPLMEQVADILSWKISWVGSRVGMVTPRVVFMVINEAYYTLQEGTASMEDIDVGMKLGTAYPFGPFEWARKIGIKNVYEVLHALHTDTGDGRYKVCPLLKSEYLKTALSI